MKPCAYYIVPEYKRAARRAGSDSVAWSSRVRYTIRKASFPSWHRAGIISDLDTDLSLVQAKRKLKTWRAYARRKRA